MKILSSILSLLCFLSSFSQLKEVKEVAGDNFKLQMIATKYKSCQVQVDSIYMTLSASQPKYTFTSVQAKSKQNNLTQSEKDALLTADSAATKTRAKVYALLNVYPLLSENSKKDVQSIFSEYTSDQLSLKQSLETIASKNEALDTRQILQYSLNIGKLDGKVETAMNAAEIFSDWSAESRDRPPQQDFQFRFLTRDSTRTEDYTAFLFPYYYVYIYSDQLKMCADNSWVNFVGNCENYVSQQIDCHKWTMNTNGKSEKLYSGPYQLVICDTKKGKVIFYDIVQVPVKDNVYPFTIQ